MCGVRRTVWGTLVCVVWCGVVRCVVWWCGGVLRCVDYVAWGVRREVLCSRAGMRRLRTPLLASGSFWAGEKSAHLPLPPLLRSTTRWLSTSTPLQRFLVERYDGWRDGSLSLSSSECEPLSQVDKEGREGMKQGVGEGG